MLRIVVIISLIFYGSDSWAEILKDSIKTTNIKVVLNYALLSNKQNSHYWNNQHASAGGTSFGPYRSGFSTGIYFIIGPSVKRNFFIGLTYSQSYAEFDFLRKEEYNPRPNFYKVRYTTSSHRKVNAQFINYEFGGRFRIMRHLYIHASTLLNYAAAYKVEEKGMLFTQSQTYNKVTGKYDTSSVLVNIDETRVEKYQGCVSARVAFHYNLKIGPCLTDFFVFRNMGLTLKLPWWGLGCGIII